MSDREAMTAEVTASDIVRLLRARYGDDRQYATATEVAECTGGGSRRLDFVAVNCYASNCYAIEGIEIKVSKADLRRELQDASKHNVFFANLDYYSLACPADIIDMSIIPKQWGVYVVKDGKLRTKRRPLALHDEHIGTIDKAFAACLMRRIAYGSPAAEEARRIRDEGYEEGKRKAEEDIGYRFSRLAKTEQDLAAYQDLFQELMLYGANDIEHGIKGFKAFQTLNLQHLRWRLDKLAEAIAEAVAALQDEDGAM